MLREELFVVIHEIFDVLMDGYVDMILNLGLGDLAQVIFEFFTMAAFTIATFNLALLEIESICYGSKHLS